ncbi:MAG: 50S ribosomal protein L7/L12 [Anaerolineae bacterium]|nr:50S ribosomal protein L7/L12 [Anaerolineae bacterium]
MADLEKLVEELSALTVLEAAQLKDMLEEKWGVTAAAPMAGMPMMMPGMMAGDAGAAAPEEEEKTEFDLVLTEVGPKKIQVIKAVRTFTTLGLAEAKAAVDGAPTTLLEAVSKEVAEDAKAKLEAEGAKAEVK